MKIIVWTYIRGRQVVVVQLSTARRAQHKKKAEAVLKMSHNEYMLSVILYFNVIARLSHFMLLKHLKRVLTFHVRIQRDYHLLNETSLNINFVAKCFSENINNIVQFFLYLRDVSVAADGGARWGIAFVKLKKCHFNLDIKLSAHLWPFI